MKWGSIRQLIWTTRGHIKSAGSWCWTEYAMILLWCVCLKNINFMHICCSLLKKMKEQYC